MVSVPPVIAAPLSVSAVFLSMVIVPELAISTRTLSVPPATSMVPEPKLVMVL